MLKLIDTLRDSEIMIYFEMYPFLMESSYLGHVIPNHV